MTRKPPPAAWVQHFEKVTQEAWEEGKDPMLALRYYAPDSPLADSNGWIDFTVMRARDQAVREEVYVHSGVA